MTSSSRESIREAIREAIRDLLSETESWDDAAQYLRDVADDHLVDVADVEAEFAEMRAEAEQ